MADEIEYEALPANAGLGVSVHVRKALISSRSFRLKNRLICWLVLWYASLSRLE